MLGAAHPVGQALCLRLAAQGGFVVALDADETPLQTLAARHPRRIAPLAMALSDTSGLQRLTASWARDPLHGVFLAHPLHDDLRLEDGLSSVAHVAQRLASVLATAGGAAVMLFADGSETPQPRAAARAYATLTETLAEAGVPINALALHPPALQPAAQPRVCQVALMMALPMAHPVRGAVMPVGRRGSRGFD